jgi:TPR repeat protein
MDFQDGLEAAQRGDFETAFREWQPLSEQGNAEAQFSLGFMYRRGDGVPQDYVQAHMWANLAAAQGNEDARGARDVIAFMMTPSQIEEAQRLAREWLAAHP